MSMLFPFLIAGFRRCSLPEALRFRSRIITISGQHFQEKIEVAAQHNVRRQAVAEGRASPLHEELMKRLKRHSALCLRTLIDSREYFALPD